MKQSVYTQHLVQSKILHVSVVYNKKQNLSCELYQLHLLLANLWNSLWPYVENINEEKHEVTVNIKYKKIIQEKRLPNM